MVQHFKPDQGWSWVVLVAAFLANVTFDGVTFSFGVYYVEFIYHFRQGKGVTSWVGAATPAMYAFVGPLAGALVNKYGCRPVAVAGSVLAAVGLILSRFSPNIWVMIITYGLMGGTGFGLMHLAAYVIVGHYFEKRRALAMGIGSCGSGVGTFIFAPLSSYLISVYAWQGALLIIAGIVLNGMVYAMTYRPVKHIEEDDGKPAKKKKLLDWSLMKKPVFIVFALSSFLCALGFFVPFMVLPALALKIGVTDPHKGAFLLSIVGITNTVGRVLSGWIADRPWGDALKIYIWVLVVGGLTTICVPWMNSYALLAGYSCVFGFTIACFIALAPIILVEFLGVDKLSDSFGFLNFFRGVACFIGPPLAGFLHDQTGEISQGLIFTGAAIATAGAICLPLRLIHRCSQPPRTDDDLVMDVVDEPNGNIIKKSNTMSVDCEELPGIFH